MKSVVFEYMVYFSNIFILIFTFTTNVKFIIVIKSENVEDTQNF